MADLDPDRPLAVVCGSAGLAGRAVVSRLGAMGWDIVTIDPVRAPFHPDAMFAMHGNVQDEALWSSLQVELGAISRRPRVFIHALSGSPDQSESVVRSAELGCESVMPLLPEGGAAVFLTSVLGTWDARSDAANFAASQTGLLGLMRAQAVRGGPLGVRVNAVCAGLVASPAHAVPSDILGRIPLGTPATPDDVADAALFLLSTDARHITGSALVVDGGQSLQSWSNAPRQGRYPPPTARPTEHQPATSVMLNEVKHLGSRRNPFPEHEMLSASPQDDTQAAMRRFEGRTVLITGAAGGLGSAAARRFAAEGANLALLDRDGAAVEQLAADLSAQGVDALALEVDVTDEEAMKTAIARSEEHFGRLDVLFNNAGVGSRSFSVAEMPPDAWDEVIAINLYGVFLGCKYGVPALARAGGGAIVNMGSSTGRHDTITGGAAYMASKAAVEAMTKSLALQAAPLGIRANTICPGIIQTQLSFRQQQRGDEERFFAEFAERIPLGRVGQPEDVAAAVAFLASDRARHITGASLLIDGGQTLPKWISAPDLDFGLEGMTP